MKQKVTYSQSVSDYNNLGMAGNSGIHAISLDQLKVKRNRLLDKHRRQGKVELLLFGNIKKVVESFEKETHEIYQLTDTITNKYVSPRMKEEAGKLKRIQKKGKFKSHQRFH
jgi:hypothetical protein